MRDREFFEVVKVLECAQEVRVHVIDSQDLKCLQEEEQRKCEVIATMDVMREGAKVVLVTTNEGVEVMKLSEWLWGGKEVFVCGRVCERMYRTF